jgi:HSP20 family protein
MHIPGSSNHNPSKENRIMYHITRYQQPRGAAFFPALANRTLWSGLETEIDRAFETALADWATPAHAPRFPVDLYEDKDNVYVRAELPGVAREAIGVEMVDDYLNLTASRQSGAETFNLARSIIIPETVQADKVTASYENGVLTVTLPKQEQAKPRKITVSVN